MKSTLFAVGVLLACLLPGSRAATAQGVGTSADLTGTITDPASAEVPNAKVTVTDAAKGLQRSVVSDEHGLYRFSGLAPSSYNVSVEHSGFQTETVKGIVLTVGQTLVLDFRLKLSELSAKLEVTSELPTVETQRGSQANTLTRDDLDRLPIDRRDYLTFTLLMPGVSNSTRLADDQDFRVKQTPQSGLSFYGSNGRGNSVTVDGAEAGDDAGGVRLTVSQDAVQEFQVNRSNYGADQGGAFGGAINIVSKSGGNAVHGGFFSYFRNDAMDAADPFARTQALVPGEPFSFTAQGKPVKNSLGRYQFGGSLGLPIKKDKTFLFVAFEGLRQDAQNAVVLLTDSSIFAGPTAGVPTNFAPTDPRAGQQAIVSALAAAPGNPNVPCLNNPDGTIKVLPAQTCAGALQTGLTISPVTGLTPGQNAINDFLINQFETNGGLFNYRTRQYLVSGRLDHHLGDSDQLVFTYRYGHDLEENPDVQSLTGFSAGSSIHLYDNTILAAWYHQFSASTQNEFRFQWDYEHFDVIPNEAAQPGLQIFGFANNLGTNIFLPSLTILRRYEIGDNVTVIRGRHTFKFGGAELLRGNHTESHTFFPGRFVFGSLPGALLSPCMLEGNPNPCGLTTNGAFMNSLQASSLGLPQVYQQGFGTADYPAYTRPYTSLFFQDSWNIMHNFTLNYGARYEVDSEYRPLNTYYRDIGPRVSFAWDPFNNHKTVVRGGYGIFFGPIDAQIAQVDLSLGVLNQNRSTVENQNNKSQVPDQVNNVVATCGIGFPGVPIFPGSGSSPCIRYIAIYVDPLTPTGLPIGNAAQVFQGLFAQGLIQCTKPAPGNSACITPADIAPFGIFVANKGQLSPLTVLFSNPPNFKPPYSQQASLGIEREIAPRLSVSLSGIYAHTLRLPVAIDTNLLNAPMTTVTLANGKSVSYRNWNTSAATDPISLVPPQLVGGAGVAPCAPPPATKPFTCFVNPLIVQNNQYTSAASALYEGAMLEVKKLFGSHYALFGNYTFSKAYDTSTDFNSDFGPQDPTNLGLDRGLSSFDQRHKVVVGGMFDSPWNQNAFLAGFQLAPIFSYNSGHPFNLLAGGEVNGDNHTTNERPIGAGRNTGLGPSYTAFDMRISWQHKMFEKANLLLTAEGFNIANHTNFASVNNEVNPLFGLLPGFTAFHVHGSAALTPSQPLGFTSAFPKREIQLGLRMTF
ncbi:MAG TPA: TonB-dependent receptor [Candidatus Acidoferrum sp.]|nr:TonB-dependent receptor [Candidatus Acidoferrum sp.]